MPDASVFDAPPLTTENRWQPGDWFPATATGGHRRQSACRNGMRTGSLVGQVVFAAGGPNLGLNIRFDVRPRSARLCRKALGRL